MNSLIKTILALSLFLFSIINLNAQNKTDVMLFGHVVNATNGEHIPYATVKVKGTRYGTITDKSGHYKLANIPVGTLTIQVTAVSDTEVGARALEVGIWGAFRNVLINLPIINNEEYKQNILKESKTISDNAKNEMQAVLDIIESRLK